MSLKSIVVALVVVTSLLIAGTIMRSNAAEKVWPGNLFIEADGFAQIFMPCNWDKDLTKILLRGDYDDGDRQWQEIIEGENSRHGNTLVIQLPADSLHQLKDLRIQYKDNPRKRCPKSYGYESYSIQR